MHFFLYVLPWWDQALLSGYLVNALVLCVVLFMQKQVRAHQKILQLRYLSMYCLCHSQVCQFIGFNIVIQFWFCFSVLELMLVDMKIKVLKVWGVIYLLFWVSSLPWKLVFLFKLPPLLPCLSFFLLILTHSFRAMGRFLQLQLSLFMLIM